MVNYITQLKNKLSEDFTLKDMLLGFILVFPLYLFFGKIIDVIHFGADIFFWLTATVMVAFSLINKQYDFLIGYVIGLITLIILAILLTGGV